MRLHRPLTLPGGGTVRLRLPHGADRTGLHALLARFGLEAGELEVRRALRCAPRRRFVLCATEWHEGRERLAGFGALEDGALTLVGADQVRELLAAELTEHAPSWSRRVA